MGWLFSSDMNTKEALRSRVTRTQENFRTIKSTWRGNNLWTIQECQKNGKTVRFIGLYLCKFSKGEGGYKDMDESVHPYYYNCPISYINEVENFEKENGLTPVGSSVEWRKEVRAKLLKTKQKFSVGQKIELYARQYEIVEILDKNRYNIVCDGVKYCMPSRMVKDATLI